MPYMVKQKIREHPPNQRHCVRLLTDPRSKKTTKAF